MFELIGCEESRKGEHLLNLLGYYEAILDRKGLAARLGEIKSLKLGFILDLVETLNISRDLGAKLNSAIISAWEMKGQENSIIEAEDDIKTMIKCIESVRKKAIMMLHDCNPINLMQLDTTVMFALPLMAKDLKSDELPIIRHLLNQAMEEFLNKTEAGHVSVQ